MVDSSAQGGVPEGFGVGHPDEPMPLPDKTTQGEAPPSPIVDMTIGPPSVAQEQPTQPGIPVLNLVTANDPEGVASLPPVATTLDPDTTASTLAPMVMDQTTSAFSSFQHPSTVATPTTAQVAPTDHNPDAGSLWAWIGDQLMAHLAQSLAATQAGGDPHTGAFAGVMEGLKEVCGLMTAGFQ